MVSTLVTGTSSADGHSTFSNPTPIVIPLGPPMPTGCPANPECMGAAEAEPYPSPIEVTGLTGTITDVNVTLRGLTHDGPADLDVMLEAPDGKTTMLMSDACGPTSGANPITTPIDLTFDQSATATLPADSQCTTGTYKPVDDDDDPNIIVVPADSFPEPAPASATTADLSVFNGSEPNGTWNLWVVDDWPTDEGAESGQFAGGWSLHILTTTSPTTTSTTTADTTTSTTPDATTTSTTPGATTTSTTPGATTTTLDDGGGSGGGTTTTTIAGGTTTTTPAGDTTPVAGPTLALSQTTVSPGDTVVVTGNGFPPNTPVQINFLSDPVRVGAVTTNAAGSFQTTVTIPSDATAGAHQINVTDSAGRVLAFANLTVVRAAAAGTGTLARTGYGTQAMIVLATGLILLGYLFFTSASAPAFTSRRRRHRW